MNTQFVKLPDGSYINPAHVSTIGQATHKANQTVICTTDDQFFYFDGDRRDEFATLLSGDKPAEDERRKRVCLNPHGPMGTFCVLPHNHEGPHSASRDINVCTWPQ